MRNIAYLQSLLGPHKISASPHPLDDPSPTSGEASWAYDVFNTEHGMRKSVIQWRGPAEESEAMERHLTSLLELDIPLMRAIARTLRQIEGDANASREDSPDALKQIIYSMKSRITEVAEAIEKHEAKAEGPPPSP